MEYNLVDFGVLIFFVIFFIFFIFLLKNQFGKISKIFVTEDKVVMDLKARIGELEKKITALELTIQVLLDKLSAANLPIPVSVLKDMPFDKGLPPSLKALTRPVLLVYGEAEFGEADRNAMRRAGVSFFRLVSSNLEDLRVELQRRRSEGRMYDVVHLAAHGGSGNVMLSGDVINGTQLSEVLNGVRCIFLSTCSNQLVADKIIGIVKYAVVVYEEIDTEDAANFTYEFYRRYKENFDVEGAFTEAIRVMPQISEYVDLRVGGK